MLLKRIIVSCVSLGKTIILVACFFCRSVDDSHDTVGAIALDSQGNVAYATSTGGINAKLPGRVGDSPIIGKMYIPLISLAYINDSGMIK